MRSTQCLQLAAGLSFVLLVACDDETADSTESTEHGDHDHVEGAQAHGGSSSGSPNRSAATERADAGDAGEAEQSGSKASSGSGGRSGDQPPRDGGMDAAAERGAAEDASARSVENAAADGGDMESAADSGSSDAASTSSEASTRRAVTIRFKAKIGEREFACGETYEGVGSQATTVTPQDLRMFIQDLALLADDGTRVPVESEVRAPWQSESVALLDFEDGTGNCSGTAETNDEITGSVPAGNYKGIRFAVGVPDALNHADPTKEADPLKSSASLSWSWLSGFRFAKIELVKTDASEYGAGMFHPGSQACAGNPSEGTVKCSKPNRNAVELEAFDPEADTIVIDLEPLFAATDLSVETACHAGDKTVCEPMFNAWGLNHADGAPKDGQTVFKTE
jgi:uncharacterized repeat protein (TIGR04052 family)